jgi:hypothetical protein
MPHCHVPLKTTLGHYQIEAVVFLDTIRWGVDIRHHCVEAAEIRCPGELDYTVNNKGL